MPDAKRRPPNSPELRRQIIELVPAGCNPEELAKEFELSAQAIRNWVAQSKRDEGRRDDGLTSSERKNRRLREEREILAEPRHGSLSVKSSNS